jgi:hypothetical protein
LFGATGTPSAVVLDEAGRVASVVGVGAEEVLALARGTVGKSEILAVNTERL